MQHGAAFKVTATVDQREIVPKRKCCPVPELNAPVPAHHPFAVDSMQKNLRVETLGPFHHRGIIMWMGDCDRSDATAPVDFSSGLIVEQSNTIPQEISSGRLQKQSTLADCEFRLSPDPEKLRRLFFQAVAVIVP